VPFSRFARTYVEMRRESSWSRDAQMKLGAHAKLLAIFC
jgi:hypothetical protein